MRSYIKHIGVFDKFNNCHYITLNEGLNVITGRSSTGKSAIIEIFDFCTGNQENTIPDGVITENAVLYFVVFEANETGLVLARKQDDKSNNVFLKVDPNFPEIQDLEISYFSNDYFTNLKAFKEKLGHFWGIDISDTDENDEQNRYRTKKGRPSFRNMVSFMLQHQNLIANKHSLFYRFDEKEKRERTIDEFKIFSGFVNQEYYILKQQLEAKKSELERINKQASIFEIEKIDRITELDNLLDDYFMISGNRLFEGVSGSNLLNFPKIYLDQLDNINIRKVNESSDEYKSQFNKLMFEKNKLISQRRSISIKLDQINSSILYVTRYSNTIDKLSPVKEAIKENSFCPFCNSEHVHISNEFNALTNAIDWLNSELMKAPKMIDSFLPEKLKLENEIGEINSKLKIVSNDINTILKVNEELEKNKSLEEQSLKVLLSIENDLEWALRKKNKMIDAEIEKVKEYIAEIEKTLVEKYNVEDKLLVAERFINESMNEIGKNLDFEDSYQPINLRFDIKTFELYHLKTTVGSDKKIYLRSMGSGANWLYSHVCLFLGLLKYFSSLGNNALVPTILFMDQPSQVYFPSTIDIDENNFDPLRLKSLEGKGDKVDEDLVSVTNLYQQILNVIKDIENRYGFKPQIIISDHADRLIIEDDNFENYVRYRWRKKNEGFINKDLLTLKELPF